MTQKANIIAAAAFIVGMAGFQFYAFQIKKNLQGGEATRLLVLTQDLSPGEPLSTKNLGVIVIPADYVGSRRVLASEQGNLVGVAVQTPLKAGDALMWSDIADGAAHRHLASLVSPGKRAYSLDSSANPLGALLRVGDYVDVLLEARGKPTLLLQRILILAVGSQLRVDDAVLATKVSSRGGVTLSLSAEQSKQLLAAEARGDLRLVLRNSVDLKKEELAKLGGAHEVKRAPGSAAKTNQEIEHVR